MTVEFFIVLGLLVSLGAVGWLTARCTGRRRRFQAVIAASIAVALIAAGQRHGTTEIDLLAWVIVAAAPVPLWNWRQQ